MPDKEEDTDQQYEHISKQVKNMVTCEFRDILDFVKKPWKLIWANFLIGVARGVGLLLGMTIIGAIVVTLIILILHKMVDMPLIGSFVARIITEVKHQLASIPR
ncbi:MAG: DUF5665 domain-containing protein [Elusimicrobia bacterium]|nr:DUF5665 domain-containing protein [Elusimicrobiota bacterium]